MKIKLAEVATAVHAVNDINEYANVEITSVAFDSRDLKPGALFIPLVADNDGHEFLASAHQNGAVATLWANDHAATAPTDFPVVMVEDTLVGLQELARDYLAKMSPKVVAITGSNGKTTTKDLIAAIGSTQYNTIKTPENFNNEIGVPITILRMEKSTELLVVEMGMDRFGQLEFLSDLVKPDMAVITMIGEAHIEFFKTRDKIADAKMEVVSGLNQAGLFIYNGDEPLLRERALNVNQAKQTFGLAADNDVYATEIEAGDYATSFKTNKWPDVTFTIPVVGEYNVANALAALVVGSELKISPENLQIALRNVVLTANRTQWMKNHNDVRILSDVYNSNPTAVKEVVKAFKDTKTTGKRAVVLGDMLELGEDSKALHASLADSLNPSEIQEVFLMGADMAALVAELGDKYPADQLHYYPTLDKAPLIADLKATLASDDVVLLKGSHGIHLEQVLSALMQ
ncbi:UDP-N-acetylmuramoyl-tripeptide--D-alanyl-D-alanine ligase [Periweissella ghanensis]|uniref:UDP-N-acetylmuramoyl-tripeptide--D-alanyl-D-alanine ligase n=1 Tax=Periweissella ghanensis TaxID=467997 RepID=A0ABN8BRA0_9LACO|nr:UDP-N-acetylmuramoyl-tripeptide--D-alanyl-D-alanine ligase [Periweissella ghanensis]MCM0601369.1 UDP-N-acetylmuramoyl-tripeptide--D-alanyl-D-alanine ligase [Periweissella ghanensis]CAH0419423.1 UDP-N-acetylmuramoyl-tripeptide--D-alanyl-D-alanine ligase [Periweissella ghanensis]